MKKNLLGILALAMIFCFSDSADARLDNRANYNNRSKVRSAVSYLNSAKRARTRRQGLKYLRRAERKLQKLRFGSSRNRRYLRYAKNNIRSAKNYSRDRGRAIMFINRAIGDLNKIRGYGRRPGRRNYRMLSDAKMYLDNAYRARRRSTVSRNLSLARQKLYHYRGRAGGYANDAIRYIDKSRRYLNRLTLRKSRRYIKKARYKVDRAQSYMRGRYRR